MRERLILGLIDLVKPGVLRRRLMQLSLVLAALLHVWVWATLGARTVASRRDERHARRHADIARRLQAAQARMRSERLDAADELLAEWRQVVSDTFGQAAAFADAASPAASTKPGAPASPPEPAPAPTESPSTSARLADRFSAGTRVGR